MDDEERSNLAALLRKAAEKTPYPYFLERLEEINACLKGGFSVDTIPGFVSVLSSLLSKALPDRRSRPAQSREGA
jgi:hypothetical protein